MPRRGDGPPQRGPQGGPQGEPFETTGAFALPNDSTGGTMPPGDTGHGAFPQDRMGEPAGPFETTGAFVRPSEWDQPPGQPNPGGPRGPFDAAGPGQQGPGPFAGPPERSPFFEGQEDNSGPFAVQPGGPGPFNGPPAGPGPFDVQPGGPGPFGGPPGGQGPFDGPPGGPGAFDGQPGHQGAFGGQPGGPGPFEGPPGHPGGFDGRPDRPGPFDAPFDGPFDGPPSGPFDGAADRTARFDVPSGPDPVYNGPPEPGDIKVAGEPTAIHNTPAWASAETGFLDSGWSSDSGIDDEPEEPKSRRGRRKSPRNDELLAPAGAGKGRVALLSVAAVAVVLGGTVAGVKLMSSPEGPAKCTGTSCAAVQATGGPPSADAADPAADVPEEEPEEEPSDDTESASTPTPTTTYAARTPRRSATPTPTPTKTKVKQSAKPTKEPTTPPPVEESVSETPTQEASTLDDDDTGVVPTAPSTANPTSTGTMGSGNAGGQSVSVQQTIKQRLTNYAATLQLSNTSAETVANPTVSLPVDGQVMNVTGAEWTQDGDLLILDVSVDLAAGTSVDVTFTATGKGSKAENCGMVTGECSVT